MTSKTPVHIARATFRYFGVRAALALACVSACAAPSGAAERVMVGYYAVFGDLPIEQVPWKRLTHACHAFLRIDEAGKPVTTATVPNPAFTADARKNGVRALLSVGGGTTAAGLQKVAADPAQATALAQAIVTIVVDNKYDGIDLDWEFPYDAASRDGFTRLVGALRTALDAAAKNAGRSEAYLLTVAVSAAHFFGEWIDAPRVAPLVDWMHVMTYDMSGETSRYAGHNAPLHASPDDPEREWRSVENALRYWADERGVPRDKLVVGIPFFGRSMPAEAPYEELDPTLRTAHRGLTFTEVQDLLGKGWRSRWDDDSLVPWLRSPAKQNGDSDAGPLETIDEAESPTLIAYDDRNSVRGKAEWARDGGYRGLFFWALHQDRMPDGTHWLLESAEAAWPAD
ncbi:MAG: glycoside hydrolase family 18 protein [Lacipirellulaceae bacterium]